MKRIIDANLNRASEASRILEEITRFLLEDKELSQILKDMRHKISVIQEETYEDGLISRDTEADIGVDMANPTQRIDIESIFKANIKRLQQALRTLAEYSTENIEYLSVFEKMRYKSYSMEQIIWGKLKEKFNRLKLSDKKIYLVTNSDNFESEDEFLDAIAQSLEGGVDILQFREKKMSAKCVVPLARKIKQLCQNYGVMFIVNDRIDIAMMVEADGVHLGQDDIDIKDARKLVGNRMIIGISTHAPQQAQKAMEDGADYIGVGPVFETPTKLGRVPVGLNYVRWVSDNINIPAFAIGGIDLGNAQDVLDMGAKRLAVVRAVINASNPAVAAREFVELLV